MRRDRFTQIMPFFHCNDNNKIDPFDKMYKLRPLMDMLKQNFIKNFVWEQDSDFDEAMIKYFGKHVCKQFIRDKPIRFGFKMWCLNAPSGYLVNFDMYQGLIPKRDDKHEELFGKCAAPLINMIEELIHRKNYHINSTSIICLQVHIYWSI